MTPLLQMRFDERQAGEGEAGRARFELAIGFAILVVEKAARKAERLFIEAEAGGHILHIEDRVAERGGGAAAVSVGTVLFSFVAADPAPSGGGAEQEERQRCGNAPLHALPPAGVEQRV